MDSFTSQNSSKFLNLKMTEISQRIYQESIEHRKNFQGKVLQDEAPETMLGKDAITQGYADKVGSYYAILQS